MTTLFFLGLMSCVALCALVALPLMLLKVTFGWSRPWSRFPFRSWVRSSAA